MSKIYDKTQLNEIVSILENDGIVSFPTDTVFALGCIYDNINALNKIKKAKGRDENKPIPFMGSNIEDISKVALVNENATKLIKKFMPGALTLVLKKKDIVDDYITNGKDTIAIRIPNDEFVIKLINRIGKPMLVTSANISGHETGTTSKQVLEQLEDKIDAIVLGECKDKVASTIVDLSDDEVKIIRTGNISEIEIFKTLLEDVK